MKRFLFIFVYIFFATLCSKAQITFNHLTPYEQLSNYSVISFYQDERGFIWIGTRNGLNLYDGKHIKIFNVNIRNKSTLQGNIIHRIMGDQRGKIIVYTNFGIDLINIKTEKITPLVGRGVTAACFKKNVLFYAKENKVFSLEQGSTKCLCILPSRLSVHSMELDGYNLLLGTKEDGLFMYQIDKKKTIQLINRMYIECIYADKSGKYWIGTQRNGFYCYNSRIMIKGPQLGKDNDVRAFCEDNNGNIWIGTMNGLYQKVSDNNFKRYDLNEQGDGLEHNSIWALMKDKQNNIWIGSFFGGVDSFNPTVREFKHYKTIGDNRLSFPIVGRMIEDKHNNLWICTDGGGLNCLDRNTGRMSHITTKEGLGHNNVKVLYYDENNDVLYIGLHMGGMDRLNISTMEITHCLTHHTAFYYIPSKVVNDIVQWKDELILATHNGIFYYNIKTKEVKPLFSHKKISERLGIYAYLFIDSKHRLWINGEQNGVCIYNLDTKRLQKFQSFGKKSNDVKSETVNSVFEDSGGRIWICTGEAGLQLFDEKKQTFKNVSDSTSIEISNCTFCMCEVDKNLYLVETDKGIYLYNYRNNHYIAYNKQNGIPLVSLFQRSLYKASDGTIFLGGMNGLISFVLRDLIEQKGDYDIYPSRLLVNGHEVLPYDGSNIIKNVLSYTDNIELSSSQSNFSIEYTVVDYIPNHRKELEYMLEGYSQQWVPMSLGHFVNFNNLKPGYYTLKVRLKDQSKCSILHIHILPPFYLSFWAYCIYFLLIVLIILFLNHTYKKRIRLQEQIKYEQQKVDYVEKVNQAKMRFFTNISHEFRTPLTLIVGQMENLLQSSNIAPVVYNKILTVYKNSILLKDLITELLDFRKQEQGMMKIKVAKHNIVSFLYENYLLFHAYANSKKVNLVFQKSEDEIWVWYDQKQLQKVINNLLSNAIKNTKEGDSISILIKKEQSKAVIEVRDTGCGIGANDIDKIFNRFYQTEDTEADSIKGGTGIGLALTKGIVELHHGTIRVESEINKGSRFIVEIPLGKDAYSKDEVYDDTKLNEEMINANPQNYEQEETIEINQTGIKNRTVSILIVEDNEDIRSFLCGLFEPLYQVMSAVDGLDALEVIKEKEPNIILSDILMPRMTGIELCRHIKNDFATCHIPVVLLTARTAIEHNLEGLQSGADDYITKPFNSLILISRCNNLVNSRFVLQEKFSKLPTAQVQMLATNPMDKQLLDEATAIIEKHISDETFNINTFAREIGMSRTNLFSKLKAVTGKTPNDFVISIRLKKGAYLLIHNPELNITDISESVGFATARYFSKCFKDAYQITPLNYRLGGKNPTADHD